MCDLSFSLSQVYPYFYGHQAPVKLALRERIWIKYSGDIWGKSWKTKFGSIVLRYEKLPEFQQKWQVTEVIIFIWKLLGVKTWITFITASKVPLIVHKKDKQLFKKNTNQIITFNSFRENVFIVKITLMTK